VIVANGLGIVSCGTAEHSWDAMSCRPNDATATAVKTPGMTAASTPLRLAVDSALPRTTMASTAPRANCNPIASCTSVSAAMVTP